MRYEHSAIRTTSQQIEVDRRYLYVEGNRIVEVLLVEDLTDDEFIMLRLRPLRTNRALPDGMNDFVVSTARDEPDYDDLWRIFDHGPFPMYG